MFALATLAATGTAFAQSSVSITGTADIAYMNVGGGSSVVKNQTLNSSYNGSSTSAINFVSSEDLGGGLRATARVELDPRAILVDGGSIATHQTFVELSGGFGAVKLGRVNTPSLDAFGAASPLGTAVGGGYGLTNAGVGMATRHARSVRYDTKAMNGFTAAVQYAPGADNTTADSFAGIPNQRQVTEVGLRYAKGPLTVAFANISSDGTTNLVTATVVPVNTAKSSFQTIGVNYAIGSTTLFAGWNKGDTIGAAASAAGLFPLGAINANQATDGTRFGLRHVMGVITLNGSYAKQDIGAITRKVTGLRAEYALSKRSAVYAAYENFDTGRAASAATNALEGGKINTTAIGVRHTF